MLKACCILVGFVLIALAARQAHRAALRQAHFPLVALINSDTLTCAATYEDVFVNGFPSSGFYFPPLTSCFRTLPSTPSRATTGRTPPPWCSVPCVLFLLQMAGYYFLIRVLTPAETLAAANGDAAGHGPSVSAGQRPHGP